MSKKNSFFWTRTKIILTVLFAIAGFFFWFSYTYINTNPDGGHIMRDASLAVFATTFVAFLYEIILRAEYLKMIESVTQNLTIDFNSSVDKKVERLLKDFIENIDRNIENKFKKSFDDIARELKISLQSEREKYINITREKLDEIIDQKMPGHYRRIREHGVVDVYKSMNNDPECKILTEIFQTYDATVKVNAIWASYIETAKRSTYIAGVEKYNIKYQFLLLDPDPQNSEVIRKRANSLPGYKESDVFKKIEENIFEIKRMFQAVHKKNPLLAKSNIQLKLHSNFISTPLLALNEKLLLGFYFSGRPSFEGAQLKIVDTGKFLYNEILQHWNAQWETAREINLLED